MNMLATDKSWYFAQPCPIIVYYSNFDESALIQAIQSVNWEGVLQANPDPNV